MRAKISKAGKAREARRDREEAAAFSLLHPPACAALCGRVGEGRLFVNSELCLVICRPCRELIDRQHERVFIPWKGEGETEHE
jgi:hypothetical protein